MTIEKKPASVQHFRFNFGTFEGFNFRSQCAIERTLTAPEIENWDHDREGEAEFWPSGDHPGISALFNAQTAVTTRELLELERLLEELAGDTPENFLRIYHAVRVRGAPLESLSADGIDNHAVHIFRGRSFVDLRKDAAFELFELYYPEEYRVWEKSTCDGLHFDQDRFLDSPSFSTDELYYGEEAVLIVSPE